MRLVERIRSMLDPYGIEAALRQRKAVRQAGGYVAKRGQG
jgi:hypothetical protein